ncbi:hypothetical protein TRECRb50_07930 [Escherichia coli]|nr:hypothetical protein TRECRb50_07930 [Escherichia coli]
MLYFYVLLAYHYSTAYRYNSHLRIMNFHELYNNKPQISLNMIISYTSFNSLGGIVR